MRGFAIPRIVRLLAKVAVVYVVAFAVWVLAAQEYHLFLGRVAARLIPLVVSSTVDRVWYDTGVHYKITFKSRKTGLDLTPTQKVTADARVDTLHFGYPVMTFLVLALALPGPPWGRRLLLTIGGLAIIIGLYAVWILIAVYEYMSGIEILFLQENMIVNLIPPNFYGRYEIPFLVFLGQALPISVYGILLFRPFLTARKSPPTSKTESKSAVGKKLR